jgi:hypothetical protein
MAHGPKQPQTLRDCKLKRVYPRLPLRVHSAAPKGFAGTGSGNPFHSEVSSGGVVCAAERRLEEVP